MLSRGQVSTALAQLKVPKETIDALHSNGVGGELVAEGLYSNDTGHVECLELCLIAF